LIKTLFYLAALLDLCGVVQKSTVISNNGEEGKGKNGVGEWVCQVPILIKLHQATLIQDGCTRTNKIAVFTKYKFPFFKYMPN